jgi:hypothetical protein
LAVFGRVTATGLPIFAGAKFDGVDGVDGLESARWADLSPDAAHVYVAGIFEAKVAVFALRAVGAVPTLSPFGLIMTGLLLLTTMLLVIRRRAVRGT